MIEPGGSPWVIEPGRSPLVIDPLDMPMAPTGSGTRRRPFLVDDESEASTSTGYTISHGRLRKHPADVSTPIKRPRMQRSVTTLSYRPSPIVLATPETSSKPHQRPPPPSSRSPSESSLEPLPSPPQTLKQRTRPRDGKKDRQKIQRGKIDIYRTSKLNKLRINI